MPSCVLAANRHVSSQPVAARNAQGGTSRGTSDHQIDADFGAPPLVQFQRVQRGSRGDGSRARWTRTEVTPPPRSPNVRLVRANTSQRVTIAVPKARRRQAPVEQASVIRLEVVDGGELAFSRVGTVTPHASPWR